MAHVKKKTDHQIVNVYPGSVSYISVTNADGTFTNATSFPTVQDTTAGYEWDATVVLRKGGTEIRLRLTAKARAVAVKKNAKDDAVPDAGTLTLTVTSPVMAVDPVPVDYVNDPAP